MNIKKLLPIIIVAVLVVAGATYFFLLRGDPKPVVVDFSPGEFFVTNIKNSGRLFKVSVVLRLDTEDYSEALEANKPQVRDIIIFVLRDMDEPTLRSEDARRILSERIKGALNTALGTEGHIVEILFNDFVIQ